MYSQMGGAMNNDDIENHIRNVLNHRLGSLTGLRIRESTVARVRRRYRATIVAASFVAALSTLGIALAVTEIGDGSQAQLRPASTPSGSTSVEKCGFGPWASHCPEADWVRDVIREAGYAVAGDTGSAITASRGSNQLNMWAFSRPSDESHQETVEGEGYSHVFAVDGVEVFGDRTRVTWSVHDLFVWLTNATGGGLTGSDQTIIEEFVKASTRTGFEP